MPRLRRLLLALLAAALIVLLVAREADQWRNFHWSAFWRHAANISVMRVLIAVAAIYIAYAVRAVRWRVLAGITDTSAFHLFSPTIIGFTAVALLGRAGELVRPWLISSREQLTFESQMLVWVVERLFDTATALVLIGAALLATSSGLPHVAAFRTVGAIALAFVMAGAVVIAFFARQGEAIHAGLTRTSRSRTAQFIGARAEHVAHVAKGLASPSAIINSTALSFGMWMLIAAAYFFVLHSFRAEAAHLSLADVLVLMGFSLAGSLIPLPAAGGQQLAVVAAMVAVFGTTSDLAVSCGILLWLTTWISIVPTGLVLLHREGMTLRNLSRKRG